ncbi:MAG: hypothetical protein LAQ30_25265 [Acidobacteriia bacterium]|nr:hypothetical protein [Terriglobia bacterium]
MTVRRRKHRPPLRPPIPPRSPRTCSCSSWWPSSKSTQFVSQLAQFSELEQVMAIRQDLEKPQQATGFAGTGTDAGGESDQTGS